MVPARLCSWAPGHHAQTGGDALGTRTPPACSSKPPPLWPQPCPRYWVLRPAPSFTACSWAPVLPLSSCLLRVSAQLGRPPPRPGALPPPCRAPLPSLPLTRSHAFAETAPPRLALPPSLGFLLPPPRLVCEKGAHTSNFSALTSVRPRGNGWHCALQRGSPRTSHQNKGYPILVTVAIVQTEWVTTFKATEANTVFSLSLSFEILLKPATN